MKKIALFLLLICSAGPAWSQCRALNFELGAWALYDYGVAFPDHPDFRPYGRGETSLFGFEVRAGFPVLLGLLQVYPSWSKGWSFYTRPMENLRGDYLPDGYGLSLPEDPANPGVLYTEPYEDLSTRADLEQSSLGAFLTLRLAPGVEIGSGLFRRKRIATYYTPRMQDEYYYYDTYGGEDHYSYWDTWYLPDRIETQEVSSLAVPLVLVWRYEGNGFFTGTEFTYWLDSDNYMSFRYGMGVRF